METQGGSLNSQLDLIKGAFLIIMNADLKRKMTPSQWLKTLIEMHHRGYLYALLTPDKKIQAVVGAWRIRRVSKKAMNEVPEKDSGKTLYVPFYVPRDAKLPLRSIRKFLRENRDIHTIVFEDNDNKLRKHRLRWRKKDGKRRKNRRTES